MCTCMPRVSFPSLTPLSDVSVWHHIESTIPIVGKTKSQYQEHILENYSRSISQASESGLCSALLSRIIYE